MMSGEPLNLPAEIVDRLGPLPKALEPGVIKALNRLLGAAVSIPVAKLTQYKARIDAQTESYKLIEGQIAKAAASEVGADPEVGQRALDVLVRGQYRKQHNREAVATAMIESLGAEAKQESVDGANFSTAEIDDDWLNVFERYAEDASSERFQNLWGRVLSGEIRRPGRFSTRTLRFLSEFSQADALTFEKFARCSFGDVAPKSLACPPEKVDMRDWIYLESSGLIQGATGMGLRRKFSLNEQGIIYMFEGGLVIALKGEPNASFNQEVIALTPLGQELLSLIPSRDPRECARAVAHSIREPRIYEAYLAVRAVEGGVFHMMEILWSDERQNASTVDG
jgi:Protein of unknown function (DUF2806)